eukprot:696574-Amphidinium_carterae.1
MHLGSEVADFAANCKDILKQFKHEGPGSTEISLDDGAELMKKYDMEPHSSSSWLTTPSRPTLNCSDREPYQHVLDILV